MYMVCSVTILKYDSIIRNFVMIDSSIWGHNTIINRNVSIDSNVLVGHDVFISENVKN